MNALLHRRRLVVIGALAVALAAVLATCRPADEPEPESKQPAVVEATAEPGVIRGRAYYLERVAMPQGSYLTVRLIDSDAPESALAEKTLHDVGNPPYDFELRTDRDNVRTDTEYAIVAELYGPDDRMQFAGLAPVDPRAGDSVRIRMSAGPADGAESFERSPRAADVAFHASGAEPGWRAEVDRGEPPAMRLALDDGAHHLELAGVRELEDGSGFVAEGAGNRALLQIDRQHCIDPFTGESLPIRVQLVINEHTLDGCGQFIR